MSAFSANSVANNTTNTTFRAWGQMFSNALANCGFVQTADTGQINWTTVAAPATVIYNPNGTSQGYEIWKFGDSLQNTNPVFFKVEYGATAQNTQPCMWWTFGSNSNGSGGITGTANTPRTQVSRVRENANTMTSYFAGNNGAYFCAELWPVTLGLQGPGSAANTTNSVGTLISFERTKNSSGTDTADGILILLTTGLYGNAFSQIYMGNTALGTAAYETRMGVLTPGLDAAPLAAPEQLPFFPLFYTNKGALVMGLNILSSYDVLPATDHVANQITVPVLGAVHTYMMFSTAVFVGASFRGSDYLLQFVLRFE